MRTRKNVTTRNQNLASNLLSFSVRGIAEAGRQAAAKIGDVDVLVRAVDVLGIPRNNYIFAERVQKYSVAATEIDTRTPKLWENIATSFCGRSRR